MPYNYPNNVPSPAKNWEPEAQQKCVKAANAVLRGGGSEEDAIFACIHAAGKSKKQEEPVSEDMTALVATDQEKAAQKARSRRYGISIREDGHITKPGKWSNVPDSQWGDPVNYLFPVPDKTHAANAKTRFAQFSGRYDSKSRAVVRGRLNRLLRKHGLEPIGNETNKENSFENSFIGEIFLQDDLPDDDPHKGMVRIPAARNSVFTHPWYGELHIDDDLFDSFIDNWRSNVVGHDLAIDPAHNIKAGALGWIKDIEKENGNLVLYAEPTSEGNGVLGDVYRYASIWYKDNFQDQETGIDYGPTLLGCAATNTPFIHRQEPMSVVMSEDGVPIGGNNYFFIYDNSATAKTFTRDNTIYTQEHNLQAGPDTLDDAGLENLEEEEAMSDKETKEALRVGDREFTAEDVQKMLGEFQQVEAQNAKLELSLQKARVDELCNKASDRGVAPVVVQTARQILMACDMVAEPSITLTRRDDGEDKEEKVNLFSAVAHMLGTVPGRIGEHPELTHDKGNDNTPPKRDDVARDESEVLYTKGKDDMTPEEAENLARKRRKELGYTLDPEPEV